MSAWFSLYMKTATIFSFLDIISVVFIIKYKHLFNRFSQNKRLFILTIIAYIIGAKNIDAWKWCIIIFPTLTLLGATNKLLSEVLILTSKWIAIILVPGIILHLINFIYPLRPIGPEIISNLYGHFNNYILYIKSTEQLGYIFRFSSIFFEPGHLGMILSYYLFALKYNYKDIIVWILTIALLLSLSLAGYVLFICGIILYSISINLKTTIKYIIIGSINIIIFSYLLTLFIDKPYITYIKSATIERLEFDEKQGIKGNNRNNESVDLAFKRFITSPNALWGMGIERFTKEANKKGWVAAGYKAFILNYGLISLLLIGYVYYKIGRKKKITFCFFLLIFISFLQRGYPFWAAWLVPYICFCLNDDYYNIKNKPSF